MIFSPDAISEAVSTRLREVAPERHAQLAESGQLSAYLDSQLLAFQKACDIEIQRNPQAVEQIVAETVFKERILPDVGINTA